MKLLFYPSKCLQVNGVKTDVQTDAYEGIASLSGKWHPSSKGKGAFTRKGAVKESLAIRKHWAWTLKSKWIGYAWGTTGAGGGWGRRICCHCFCDAGALAAVFLPLCSCFYFPPLTLLITAAVINPPKGLYSALCFCFVPSQWLPSYPWIILGSFKCFP